MAATQSFFGRREDVGSDLRTEFEAVVADIRQRASDRSAVVAERLRTLEAEEADLQQLERQISATSA